MNFSPIFQVTTPFRLIARSATLPALFLVFIFVHPALEGQVSSPWTVSTTTTVDNSLAGIEADYTLVPESNTEIKIITNYNEWDRGFGAAAGLEAHLNITSPAGPVGSIDTIVYSTNLGDIPWTDWKISNGSGTLLSGNPPYYVTFSVQPGQTYTFSAVSGQSGTLGTPSSFQWIAGTPLESPLGNLGQPVPSPKNQPNELVAEPVSATTGAFYENDVDLHVNGPLPIEVRRTYSSLNASVPNELGFGWLLGYPSYLVPSTDGSTIQAADSDGTIVTFRLQQGSLTTWAPSVADNPGLVNSVGANNLFNSTIVQTGNGIGSTYQWNLSDGSVRKYVVQSFPLGFNGGTVSQTFPYLSQWQDNRGNALSFTYGALGTNSYGRIDLIQSSNGTSVSLTYDTLGHITQAAASDGRAVNYTYTNGDLTKVVLPDQSEFDYQYGAYGSGASNHLITQKTSPGGRILQNVYDNLGRVVQQLATADQADPRSLVFTDDFDYSVPRQTTITDANGNATIYYYNNSGLITQIKDANNQSIYEQWYSPTDTSTGAYPNSLKQVIDKRGLTTLYQYDANGNIAETDVTGDLVGDGSRVTATTKATFDLTLNLPLKIVDPRSITTKFAYGDGQANHRYLPTEIDTIAQDGSTTIRSDTFGYSDQSSGNIFSNGLLQTKTVTSGPSDQSTTNFQYNAAGFMTQQTAQTGTGDPAVVTQYTPTARNELGTVTDGDQRTITYTYDGMSRPLSKTVKDENGNTLGVWNMTYTGEGDLSQTYGPHANPANTVQRFYDGAGNLEEVDVALSQANANGTGVTVPSAPGASLAITNFVYDFVGNQIWQMDPLGNVTTMAYDADNEMTGRSTFNGSNTTVAALHTESWLYEPGGKVSQYTNPLGGITYYTYTFTGQPSSQTNPDGSVLQWRYDTNGDGRLHQQILSNGATWTYAYKDDQRTVVRTLADSLGNTLATETSVFDCRGNLISRTDTDGFVHTFTYDGLNRVKTATGPGATSSSAQQVTTFLYGASDKVISKVNELGQTSLAISDGLGRPVEAAVFATTDITKAPVHITSYLYSTDNNSVQVIDGGSSDAISHVVFTDTLNRPILTTYTDKTYTTQAYDLNGNLVTTTDALGQATNYGYNALNQLTSETSPDGAFTQFNPDPAGNLLSRTMPGGQLAQSQTFDGAGRITSESLSNGANSTRNYSYKYYQLGSPWVGLLYTKTGPRDTVTYTYDNFLRPATVTTADITGGTFPATNSSTIYGYDNRGNVKSIAQSSAGLSTSIGRTFDGYSQLITETVAIGSVNYANIAQTWDAAGRRVSLNEASSSLLNPSNPLFVYNYQADGLLTNVAAPGNLGSGVSGLNYRFAYGDNGLLTSRTNPFRVLTIDSRDLVGRVTHETATVNGAATFIDSMHYRADGTMDTYAVGRADGWNETRNYSYDSRGQLVSEGFSPVPNVPNVLNYAFDGGTPGIGLRTDAKIGTGSPASWEIASAPNSLGQVTTDTQLTLPGQTSVPPAAGTATNADHVDVFVDGAAQGRAALANGNWSMNLDLAAGSHTLKINAVDFSGLQTATASKSFTTPAANPAEQLGAVTEFYDGDGNVSSRSYANGTVQTLTWDAFNRLMKVSQRDSANNGYDWSAAYDGVGRRISTSNQPVTAGIASGSATSTASEYDPQVEFLEIGTTVNNVRAWKVYGPDMNGTYGGMQGTGGLEATVLDSGGTATGVLNDYFGNGVATITGTGSSASVTWNTTHVGAYGPLPGNVAQPLTNAAQLASVVGWRGHVIDPTGFYWLGARYYEPTSGRFLSADPLGHAASMSLYDFCNGDPLNRFDADGRCPDSVSNAANEFSQIQTLHDKLMSSGFESPGHVYLPPYVPTLDAYDAYFSALSNIPSGGGDGSYSFSGNSSTNSSNENILAYTAGAAGASLVTYGLYYAYTNGGVQAAIMAAQGFLMPTTAHAIPDVGEAPYEMTGPIDPDVYKNATGKTFQETVETNPALENLPAGGAAPEATLATETTAAETTTLVTEATFGAEAVDAAEVVIIIVAF